MSGQRQATVLLWCVACLWLLADHAPAQVKPTAAQPLEFRRVFVPADRLESLLSGYHPVPRTEFQELLATVNVAPKAPGAVNVRLVEASYAARLEQNDLVDGQAHLRIEHEIASDAILNLEPCSLAVQTPTWEDDERPARLGVDAAGKMAVVVEPQDGAALTEQPQPGSSKLAFAWSLRGARDPSGALVFDLQTPACATAQLTLDLPAGTTPVVSQGLVSPAAKQSEDSARRAWFIELGGRTRTELSIVSDESLKRRERYVLLRQSTNYQLTPEALEAITELRLDIFHEPLRQLTLDIDSTLRITSVRLGEAPLAWSLSPTDDDGKQRLVIEFPEPLTGHDRVLRIAGLAGLQRSTSWRLPIVEARGVVWQEGTLALHVPEELELCELTPHSARQTKVSSPSAPRRSELHQFQSLASAAALTVKVQHRPARLLSDEGLTLKWDGPHLTGRLVTNITSTAGSAFELRGRLSAGWIIDGIEATPATALADWSVANGGQPGSALNIRLAEPIAAEQPLQIIVLGHRRAPARNERLQPREYRLVEWDDVEQQRRLVSVQTDAQRQLVLSGDAGLERIDARQLSAADRALIEAGSSRLAFLDASAQPGFSLALRNESPRFTAETLSRFALSGEILTESHTVRIVPDATPVSRVVVRLGATLPRPVQWKLDREPAGEFSARQLASEEGELWELSLTRPQTAPLNFLAERQTTLRVGDAPRTVPLLVVNEADTQRSEVLVESLEGAAPVVAQQGLRPAMIGADQPHARARFRYQPAQDQQLSIAHADPRHSPDPVWAWQHRILARVNAAGQTIFTAYYQLENTGAPQVTFGLPEASVLRLVRVNGARLPANLTADNQLLVPLPSDDRYPTVQIEYSRANNGTGVWQTLDIASPETRLPVLRRHVELWLAPELKLQGPAASQRYDWLRRLFGPLARPAGEAPPSLFSRDDWRRQLTGDRLTPAEHRRVADCLDAWEQSLPVAGEDDQPPTWGQWIEHYERRWQESGGTLPTLRLDADSLAAAAIYPDSPLVPLGKAQVEDVLEASGLALVIDQQQVVLTTLPLRGAETAHPVMRSIFVARDREPQGISAASWRAQPQPVRSPWQAEGRAALVDLQVAGWNVHRLVDSEDAATRVHVYRWKDIQAIAWGLFLASAGAAACLVRRVRGYLVALAALAIVALWVPDYLAPLATALFAGTLAGGLTTWLLSASRKAATRKEPTSTRTLPSPVPASVGATVLLVGVLLWTGAFAQQPPPAAEKPVQPEAYRVLMPVDDEQKPSGDYVYLPKPFYEALVRQAQQAKAVPQGWIVYDAIYRGRVQTAMGGGKLHFADLTASYDLEVFQPNARVSIALGREGLHLLDDRASLDGTPVQLDWLETGESFSFLVERPGRYRLEFSVRPASKVVAGREQIDLRIPRVAQAELLLSTPVDAVGVQIAGAQGHATEREPGSWRVELGPTSRLAIYWPSGDGSEETKENVEVSQLLWWKLRPGAAVLESKWTFKATSPLAEVRLVADPRLRLMPLGGDQPVARHSVREGDVQAIQFALEEPFEREVTIHASFTLSDSAAIGQLSLPRLEAVADRTTRRWLAVSADAPLEARLSAATQAETVTAQDFLNAWGGSEAPSAAFRLAANETALRLEVQPRSPLVTARQALTYALDASRVRIELEALVNVADGPIFQHRLRLPADWQIDEATITAGETVRPLRVATSSLTERTLFLPGAAAGEHRLLLKASGPLTVGNWTLPAISLVGASVDPPLVFLERNSQVNANLVSSPGYQSVADMTAPPSAILWRRLAVLKPLATTGARHIELQVQRNNARLTAQQVLSIRRQDDAWEAVVDLHCQASGGVVESLRFEIPPELQGVRMNRSGRIDTIEVAGQTRKHLVLSLQESQRDAFSLQLTMPLADGAGERLQAPEIRLLDAESVETWVALPTEIEGQQLAWETRGLQAAPLPQDKLPAHTTPMQVFRAPSGRYQAMIKRFERVAGVPQVRLADVRMFMTSAERSYGIVSFDLQPAGLTHCRVRLPAGQQLIQVLVSGVPATAQRQKNGDFQVLLHHDQLPQQIEVLFLSESGSFTEDAQALSIPTLVQIPVERTLWTIASPAEFALAPADGSVSIDPARQTAYRLNTAGVLLEHAASHASDPDADQTAAWFARWAEQTTRLHATLERFERTADEPSSLASQRQALADEAQAIAQQWGVSEAVAVALRNSTEPKTLMDIASTQADSQQPVIAAMLPGAAPSLELRTRAASDAETSRRVVAVLLVVALFCLALALSHWRPASDFVARSPHVAGVALGIAWWLLLSPALVGVAICALFALAALRWPWPRTSDLSTSGFHPTLQLPRGR